MDRHDDDRAASGGTGGETDLRNFCCPEYLTQLTQRVFASWDLVGRNQPEKGLAIVRFTLRRDGSVILDRIEMVQSSGSTILHEADSGSPPPNHEITTFYVDGDRLLATHYCDAGNRVRWEGKMSPDGKTFEFSFLDVAGGTQRGFVKRTVFTIIDANKQIVELTYIMPDGKPVVARGEFGRTE